MGLLGWLFVGWQFRSWRRPGRSTATSPGGIVLAAAPCTAMVLVWPKLTDGEPNFTLTQLALHDTIMVLARDPLVGLLLGLPSISIRMPRKTRFLSVALRIVVPVIAARSWRRSLLASGVAAALAARLRRLGPLSLLALLAEPVRRFGFQGAQIVSSLSRS